MYSLMAFSTQIMHPLKNVGRYGGFLKWGYFQIINFTGSAIANRQTIGDLQFMETIIQIRIHT